MMVSLSVFLKISLIAAGGHHAGIAYLNQTDIIVLIQRILHGNPPCAPVRLRTNGADIPAQRKPRRLHALLPQKLRKLIRGISLRNAAKVHRHALFFQRNGGFFRIHRNILRMQQRQQTVNLRLCRYVLFLFRKAPCLYNRRNRNVKGVSGCLSQFLPRQEHRKRVRRNGYCLFPRIFIDFPNITVLYCHRKQIFQPFYLLLRIQEKLLSVLIHNMKGHHRIHRKGRRFIRILVVLQHLPGIFPLLRAAAKKQAAGKPRQYQLFQIHPSISFDLYSPLILPSALRFVKRTFLPQKKLPSPRDTPKRRELFLSSKIKLSLSGKNHLPSFISFRPIKPSANSFASIRAILPFASLSIIGVNSI